MDWNFPYAGLVGCSVDQTENWIYNEKKKEGKIIKHSERISITYIIVPYGTIAK